MKEFKAFAIDMEQANNTIGGTCSRRRARRRRAARRIKNVAAELQLDTTGLNIREIKALIKEHTAEAEKEVTVEAVSSQVSTTSISKI